MIIFWLHHIGVNAELHAIAGLNWTLLIFTWQILLFVLQTDILQPPALAPDVSM